MTDTDPKRTLLRYLQSGREALLWKLEGLSEYDARRPLTPTATNLLGIVKHVASNHGGSVGVWSEEGLGSTFTLRIPLAAGIPVADISSKGNS